MLHHYVNIVVLTQNESFGTNTSESYSDPDELYEYAIRINEYNT